MLQTIRGRLLILAVCVEALMLSALILNSLRLVHSSMLSQVQLYSQQIGPVLRAALTAPLISRDYATLQAVVKESREVSGLVYIAVIDRYGHRLVSNGWPIDVPLPAESEALCLSHFSVLPKQFDAKVSIMLRAQPIGEIHFGIDLKHVQQTRKSLLFQGSSIAVAELFLSATMLFLIGVWITRHLTALTDASRLVAAGQLTDLKLPEGTDDIGHLSSAFRIMSKAVSDRLQELSEAKEAAELSELRLRSIMHSANDAIIMINEHWKVLFWNPAAERIFGVTATDASQRDFRELLAYPHVFDSVFEKLSETQWIGSYVDLQLHRKDGQTVDVVMSISAAFLQNSWHLVGMLRDISELKKKSEENSRLQAQLQQSQKMEAIGTLAGGIAHDFNNILGSILGFSDLAKSCANLPEQAETYLQHVTESSHRAAALVRQILDFSRQTDAERLVLQPAQYLRDILSLLRPSLPANIEIRQNLPTTAAKILADPTHLHQILINLCTNAIHSMEETGGILQIELRNRTIQKNDLLQHPMAKPGDFVELVISDTGAGIQPEIWGRIFEPYFTTKSVGKGTGLGLSIIHGIITSYGGFIESEKNGETGTTFRVFFPAAASQAAELDAAVEQPILGSSQILFVDDERELTTVWKLTLEQLGYTVSVAAHGLQALNLLQQNPEAFDVLITDLTMPVMLGTELIRRARDLRPDLPAILCTGYASTEAEKQAALLGIKHFVEKPLTAAVLTRKIADALRSSEI